MNESPLLPTLQKLYGSNLTLAGYYEDWRLPAYYAPRGDAQAAVAEEYAALTGDGVVIADRSWRSIIQLRGRDRLSFLQGMVTNDVAKLEIGQGCRAAMLGSNGHMLADMVVYAPDEETLLLSIDPRTAGRVLETLDKYLIAEKVVIKDITARSAKIMVAGRGAADVIQNVTSAVQLDLEPDDNVVADFEGSPILITRSGARNEVYYELLVSVASATRAWEALASAGAIPVGEIALEIARVEAGDPAWGSDLDETVLFPEAELTEALSYTKGCYVGQEIIARIHARGHVNKALRGVLFDDGDSSMQHGDPIFTVADDNGDSKEIGRVTSAVVSPRFDGRVLALAYIRREHNAEGTEVVCRYAHREAYGTVMVPPFTELQHP